jgi:hypothetical protein
MDDFVTECLPGEIVESITGAMRCDQIIRIDLSEFLNRLADIGQLSRGVVRGK